MRRAVFPGIHARPPGPASTFGALATDAVRLSHYLLTMFFMAGLNV